MPKSRKLVIVGNSEIACMAYEYFTHDSDYTVAAFAINSEFIKEDTLCELPVVDLDGMKSSFPPDEYTAFVAIGDSKLNRVRRRHFDWCKAQGYNLASYISSKAHVWHDVKIGENCFIFEANVLQPFVEIGDNCIVWSGNHIGHRTVVEDDVFIASHVVISGYCRIGRWSFLGVNVAVANNVHIGQNNFLGIGVIATRNTSDNTMWKAAPSIAREIGTLKALGVES